MFDIFGKIIKATIYSFKFLKNPFVIFEIPFKKNIKIVLKNNEEILIERRKFPLYMRFFQNGWSIKDNYYYKKYYIKVRDISILFEDFDKFYGFFDLKEKKILDIGGLYGETALYFRFEKNANIVFVYEPIKENFELINENISKNKSEKKIISYNKGVSNKNGFEIIETNSPPGTAGFGMPGNKYSIKIPVESWDTILERHKKDNIYLAKVDCEGGEKYLVEANKELIKTIPNWVIETHSLEIEKNIIELFESLGYKKEFVECINKKLNVKIWRFW